MNEVMKMLNSKILNYAGISIAASQVNNLQIHIEKKAAARNITPLSFCQELKPYSADFDEIINLVTVNETYFFREEAQFDFLKKEVFPKYMGRKLTIWTCCCSTGEEAISLLALALSMNVNLTIYASDIDDNALSVLKKGVYSVFSLRSDGQKYHPLLEPYSTRNEREIIFRKDFLERIHTFRFNLISDFLSKLPFYEDIDILFMRNVFIYFDKATRSFVTRKLTGRLKPEGLLFFSMNEVGSIDEHIIPKNICKTNSGPVYYFVKENPAKKSIETAAAANKVLTAGESRRRTEAYRQEVKKIKIQKFSEHNEKVRKAKAALDAVEKTENKPVVAFYESICQEINKGDFDKARAISRSHSAYVFEDKKFSYFMQGYVEYHAENKLEAEHFFAVTEGISPDFWPALFYRGMVLRDLGRTALARSCFSKCKKLISDYGSELPYAFTLDEFSPAYISSVCESFLMESEK